MNLKEIIYEEAKKTAAEQHGSVYWNAFVNNWGERYSELEAHKIALDRLDKVMRWASLNGWVINTTIEDRPWFNKAIYKKDMRYGLLTESELYTLFKESEK